MAVWRPRTAVRRAGIATTAVLALALLTPITLTATGVFSQAEWYGQRSEGVRTETTGALFRYVIDLWKRALLRTVQVVASVVPLALLLGAPAAWAFRRRPFPGSRLLESAALAPLSVPGVALAFSLLQTAGAAPRFSLLVAVHLAYALPLVVKSVTHAVETFDPCLEGVARTLGAGPWETARRVTVPLLGPALVLSSLLVFAVSWGEFNASFLLATPLLQTFPATLYLTYTTHSFPVAATATLVFLAPVIPALIAIQLLGGEEFHRGLQA